MQNIIELISHAITVEYVIDNQLENLISGLLNENKSILVIYNALCAYIKNLQAIHINSFRVLDAAASSYIEAIRNSLTRYIENLENGEVIYITVCELPSVVFKITKTQVDTSILSFYQPIICGKQYELVQALPEEIMHKMLSLFNWQACIPEGV